MNEVLFPVNWDLYFLQQAHQLALEIYGVSHTWLPNTAAVSALRNDKIANSAN